MASLGAARTIRLRRRLAIAAGATIAALVLGELAARAFAPSLALREGYRAILSSRIGDMSFEEFARRQEEIRRIREEQGMERGRSDPILGWTYNPGFRMRIPGVDIRINSHGLRGEDFPDAKPRGELRILCLGGSTTACEEVEEAFTWPSQLERRLLELLPGKSVRVINGGIPTYDVRASWIDYSLRLSRFDPDVVVVYHGINDLLAHLRGGVDPTPVRNYAGDVPEPFVHEQGARRSSLGDDVRSLLGKSRLVRLARSALSNLRRGGPPDSLAAPSEEGLATFEATYRALLRNIRAGGAHAVPVTFATADASGFDPEDARKVEESFSAYVARGIVSHEMGRAILDRQNEITRRLAQEEEATLCELAGRVPSDRHHFVDCCHFTQEGNRVVANVVAVAVAPLLEARASAGARPEPAVMKPR